MACRVAWICASSSPDANIPSSSSSSSSESEEDSFDALMFPSSPRPSFFEPAARLPYFSSTVPISVEILISLQKDVTYVADVPLSPYCARSVVRTLDLWRVYDHSKKNCQTLQKLP